MISNILIRFVQKYPFFCWFPCVFFNRKKRQSIKILSTKTRNSRGPIGNLRKKSGPNFQCKLGVMWTVTWRTKKLVPIHPVFWICWEATAKSSPWNEHIFRTWNLWVSQKERIGFLCHQFSRAKMLVSGRLSLSLKVFFPGKDWDVCTLDTQDFARLVRCSRKEPHV